MELVAMIGSWAIQGGVEFFLAFILLKALGMTALTWLIILFFVVYTILQYIDQVVHRMPRTILAPCARVFAYFIVAGLLGLNLEKLDPSAW